MVPRSSWAPESRHPVRFMGIEDENGEEVPESADEGCPGGWYRCVFVWSVARYFRSQANGTYSENLHLSRCEDRLVLDAVNYYETERSRWRAWALDQT